MSNGKVTCSKEVEVSLDCCMGNTFKVGVTLNDVNERRLVGEDAILGSCQLVQKVSKEMSHSWPEREKETVENLNKVDQSRLEGATSGSESDQQDDLLVEKVNQYSQPRDIVQKDVEEEGLVGQKENLSTSKPELDGSIAVRSEGGSSTLFVGSGMQWRTCWQRCNAHASLVLELVCRVVLSWQGFTASQFVGKLLLLFCKEIGQFAVSFTMVLWIAVLVWLARGCYKLATSCLGAKLCVVFCMVLA
ncbi:hypothetical protein V6N11_021267 [Hibiscus sabdariffa]|uniref:Uncharacterized protein n=2 Tax=Hibiscus sabdariffa TaxID=183260 RepID=A0ABR2NLZ0_9ROSI